MRLAAPRPSVSALLFALTLAVASCTGQIPKGLLDTVGGSASPSPGVPATGTGSDGATASATPKPLSGGIISEEGPTPTSRPTATPMPQGTSTPQTSQAGQGPFTLSIVVNPSTASIRLAPRDNISPPLGPTEVQLRAVVTFTNGLQSSQATWRSSDSSIATVDSLGLVKVGTVAGTAEITAEGQFKTLVGAAATQSCIVDVSAKGDVEVVVQ
ncbi:MAG: Ig-like domain-containing protein [Candidatus Sericytochromatia bacterium]|uniref:Ig-like domain-containing protein n=1 Tax=Candidatus Tanganyikabacteria bacterium TaxID=2961651 RepID=A0A937X4K4_9BACT|nr:Ig-like domain-containing protein [Candidatus Tanganyikabacteria bacterium]